MAPKALTKFIAFSSDNLGKKYGYLIQKKDIEKVETIVINSLVAKAFIS
ncbi:hypothetical protein VIBNISFn118_140031 [Vibrio nigripulchritudo SFn118]|nr:hypothetical protein VIBNISFn118_140031 [Vibrio nigripulchritudo SFn118]